MCQAKSLGGKRCAIHHHGTQAAIQTTVVKTSVDTPLVKEVFSELNKEGKKLSAPSREEFEGYLAKERFMTEIDSSIDDRNKKMILKKLDKAAEENTPSGGTFHAWKNLLTTTINKYGKKAKMVFAAITLGTVVSVTGGCAQVGMVSANDTISASGIISSFEGSNNTVGDVVVTDELGSYMKGKLDPSFPLATADKVDMTSITPLGYTDADVQEAQQFIANFTATEMVDSNLADNPAAYDNFVTSMKENYLTGYYADALARRDTQLVYQQTDGLQFARDGKTRFSSNKTSIDYVQGTAGDAYGTSLNISGTTQVDYRVPDKNILTWYQTRHPEMTTKQITDKLGLKDNKEETLRVDLAWQYWLQKDANGAWKIAGFSNSYEGNIVGMDVTK